MRAKPDKKRHRSPSQPQGCFMVQQVSDISHRQDHVPWLRPCWLDSSAS